MDLRSEKRDDRGQHGGRNSNGHIHGAGEWGEGRVESWKSKMAKKRPVRKESPEWKRRYMNMAQKR